MILINSKLESMLESKRRCHSFHSWKHRLSPIYSFRILFPFEWQSLKGEKNRVSFTLIDKCFEFFFPSLFLIPLFHLHLFIFSSSSSFNFIFIINEFALKWIDHRLRPNGFFLPFLVSSTFVVLFVVSLRWSFSFSNRSFFSLNTCMAMECGVFMPFLFHLIYSFVSPLHRCTSHSISISFAHLSRVDHSITLFYFSFFFSFSTYYFSFVVFVLSIQFVGSNANSFWCATWCCRLWMFVDAVSPSLSRSLFAVVVHDRLGNSNECFLINV